MNEKAEDYKNVQEYLAWAKKVVDAEIPKIEKDLHDKFLLNSDDVLRGGKRFRPSLVLLAAQAIAGEDAYKKALDYAMAVEMIHSFSLNIDDILDMDEIRRGNPSEWVMMGLIPAFLAGLGGITQAFALGSNNHRAMQVLNETIQAMSSGAVKEMVSGNVFKRDFLINIIVLKTGALMATSTQMGAIAVDAPSRVEEAFRKYGLNLGIAYQLQDDLNDIMDSLMDMKPHGDLKEYRLTLPLYMIHETFPDVGSYIDMFLNRDINFNTLAKKMWDSGGMKLFQGINDEIERYIGKAIMSLKDLDLVPEYKEILEDLPYYMINAMRKEAIKNRTKEPEEEKEDEPEEEDKPEAPELPSYSDWIKTLPPSAIAAVSLLQVGMSKDKVMEKTNVEERELDKLIDMLKMYEGGTDSG